jgi:hypothetical protein
MTTNIDKFTLPDNVIEQMKDLLKITNRRSWIYNVSR